MPYDGSVTASTFIAFDFDDTLTDTSTTGPAFEAKYEAELMRVLGRENAALAPLRAIRENIVADPAAHGWRRGEVVVARASSDHFILNRTAATLWFDVEHLFAKPVEREAFLELLYSHCYATAPRAPLKPEVRDVVAEQQRRGARTCVFSNSAPDRIAVTLGAAGVAMEVRGHAKKFEVDTAWSLPGVQLTSLNVPGLERSVALQRRQYHDALAAFCEGMWSALTVVGDNFELDLALPHAMGASIVLIETPQTPAYEVAFVKAYGRVIRTLRDL